MKIWNGYGSEHSMNLVMIGRFKEVDDAMKAKEIMDLLIERVTADEKSGAIKIDGKTERYGDEMLNLLGRVKVHSISPPELEQFAYDVRIKVNNNEVVLTTDEVDVSAFLKILLDKGARVEVYSAHDYADTGYGR